MARIDLPLARLVGMLVLTLSALSPTAGCRTARTSAPEPAAPPSTGLGGSGALQEPVNEEEAQPETAPEPEGEEHVGILEGAEESAEVSLLPALLFADPASLMAARENAALDRYTPTNQLLRRAADQALASESFSVMKKSQLPPSGDIHDYLSLGRYWWPDPEKSDGLPYIWRDGEINPEIYEVPDKQNLQEMIPVVSTLAHAFFVFDDARYAERAAALLRTFFLDPATRMNPNLNYGQVHRGHTKIKGGGIVDTRDFPLLLSGAKLLEMSQAWSATDAAGLRAWFEQFLEWLQQSPQGQAEAATKNNHKTFYLAQVAGIAAFLEKNDLLERLLREEGTQALADQIEEDGSMPRELDRTKPFSYTVFGLWGFSRLADLGLRHGIDLWNAEGEDGKGSLRRAFAFALPCLEGRSDCPIEKVDRNRAKDLSFALKRAALVYEDPTWSALAAKLAGGESELQHQLIDPPMTH